MRTLLIALMIALLPLRGWVGDAMAVQMLVQPSELASAVASNAVAAHVDCHDSVASSTSAGQPEDHTQGHDGKQCNACQICHTVAMSTPAAPAASLLAEPIFAAVPSWVSISAPRQALLKPPIS